MNGKNYEISYYEDFRCAGEACPDCCCRGWRIPLTDEDVLCFAKEKGMLGVRLQLAMKGDETLRVFSEHCIRCPFMTLQGLCELQKKKGHDFIPETCRTYPRSVIRHLDYTERHLDLSCVQAASLFLKDRRKQNLTMYTVAQDEEAAIEPYGNNEDAAYLEALLSSRKEMIAAIREVKTAEEWNGLLSCMDAFATQIQERTLKEGGSVLTSHSFSAYRESSAHGKQESVKKYFPMPIGVLNQFLSTDYYESSLRYRAPYLYHLCRAYYKRFDRLDYAQGQELLTEYFERYIASDPEEVTLYADHFASILYRHYTESFEDYSIHVRFTDALIVMNLHLLFRLLCFAQKERITQEDGARILSVTEKRFFHNEKIQKQLRAALTESRKLGYHK